MSANLYILLAAGPLPGVSWNFIALFFLPLSLVVAVGTTLSPRSSIRSWSLVLSVCWLIATLCAWFLYRIGWQFNTDYMLRPSVFSTLWAAAGLLIIWFGYVLRQILQAVGNASANSSAGAERHGFPVITPDKDLGEDNTRQPRP